MHVGHCGFDIFLSLFAYDVKYDLHCLCSFSKSYLYFIQGRLQMDLKIFRSWLLCHFTDAWFCSRYVVERLGLFYLFTFLNFVRFIIY